MTLLVMALAACSAPRTPAPNIDSADVAAEAAKQREFYARRLMADEERLWAVSYPLLTGGAALCGEVVKPTLGFRADARQYHTGEYSGLIAKFDNLTDRPQVVQVAPRSPAEAAGIEVGDQILEVGGQPVQSGRDFESFQDLVRKNLVTGQPVTLKLKRGAETVYASPEPVATCDYPIQLVDKAEANAMADGEQVLVFRGMLRLAETDQHLATIVGHELAHNTMEHREAKEGNAVAAGAGGLMLDIGLALLGVNTQGAFMKAAAEAGAGAYSVEFEQEADYVGLYFLARGGYPTEGAADIWRIMAADNPKAIDHRSTHPTTPERFLALEQVAEEIEMKRQDGEALMPTILPEPDRSTEGGRFLESAYPE